MEHTNTLCGQNAENLYIETCGTLDIKGLSSEGNYVCNMRHRYSNLKIKLNTEAMQEELNVSSIYDE
jgi:hypothetical protein